MTDNENTEDLAGTNTPPDSENTPPATGGDSTADWKQALPEELRNDPTISRYKTTEDLAKAHKEARTKLGWDPTQIVKLPGENAKPEDFEGLYKALGRPTAHNDYETPEIKNDNGTFKFNGDFVEAMKKAAFDSGMGKRQFEKLMRATGEYHQQGVLLQGQSLEEKKTKFEKDLKTHWGDKTEENQRLVDKAREFFSKDGINQEIEMMDLMASKGRTLLEDSAMSSEAGGGTGGDALPSNAASAKAQLDEMKKDPDFLAKRSSSNPKFDAAFAKKVSGLFAVMNPESKK